MCGYKYVSQDWGDITRMTKTKMNFPFISILLINVVERRNAWTDSSLLCFLDIIFSLLLSAQVLVGPVTSSIMLFYYFRIIRLQVIVIPKGFHTALPHTENISSKKPISIFY